MLKMKTPNIPIHLPNRFNVSKKIDPPLLTSPSMGPVIPDVIPAEPAPNEKSISSSLPASIKSDNAANQPNANKVPKLPVDVQGSVKDELFALLHGAYQKSVSSASTQKSQKPLKTTTNPDIIQSNELERQKNLFLLISGRAEETTSVKPVYTAKSNHAKSRTASTSVRPAGKILPDGKGQSSSTTTGIPPEYDDLAKLVSSLPEGFDLTGWDDKSTREQRSAMQKSGLSSQAQMQLLNASTSIETIAIVQDIQRNRVAYGLSTAEVNKIAENLFKITNTRIGVKNQHIAYTGNPTSTKLLLQVLDKAEAELIGPYMDMKGTVFVPTTTSKNYGDTRYVPSKGQYVGYNTIDLTDDLYSFMRESAAMLKELKDTARERKANFMQEFIGAVDTHGALDIKNQESWKFRQGLTYLFEGKELRNDDPGNIAFGYYGSAVYGKNFLHLGAGINQLLSDIKRNNNIQWEGKFFDDPQDFDMIEYGYNLYMEEHPK